MEMNFAAVGEEKDVAEIERILREKYKMKVEKLGGGASDSKEIRVLNKVLRYTDKGLELEADPRHAELVVKELRLEGSKPSRVPGSKADMVKVRETEGGEDEEMNALEVSLVLVQRVGGKVVAMSKAKTQEQVDWELMAVDQEADEGEEELGPAEAKIYRGITARLNYIAPDRVDLQYATKEAARRMSKPRACDMNLLKRIGRYLVGRPRLIMHFGWQAMPSLVTG